MQNFKEGLLHYVNGINLGVMKNPILALDSSKLKFNLIIFFVSLALIVLFSFIHLKLLRKNVANIDQVKKEIFQYGDDYFLSSKKYTKEDLEWIKNFNNEKYEKDLVYRMYKYIKSKLKK